MSEVASTVQAAKDAHPAFAHRRPAAEIPLVDDLREKLRRRVTWLRTTAASLPAYITGALADEIEQLLDQLERDEVDESRHEVAHLVHPIAHDDGTGVYRLDASTTGV